MLQFKIISFYKFVTLADTDDLKVKLLNFCKQQDIKGTIIISKEGINSTLAARQDLLDKFCNYLKTFNFFDDIKFKESSSKILPFKKLKVKLKKEIIAFNVEGLDLSKRGIYLNSKEWDKLIKNEDTIVIDTRNYYEYAMGTFKRAINPHIHHFAELPRWLEGNLRESDKKKNVAMFCTGGIRCEKSTAYLKQLGFENIYHLKDGIIKYLEDSQGRTDLTWQGRCFVFDDRINY